jgi:hypothetical protein
MADINVAYLEMRLSGGAANTNPNAALGGDLSSERILAQSTTALTNITGVVIDYAGGNPTGAGTLTYVNAAKTLQWQPYGLTAGVAVNVPADGRYALFGEDGELLVTVDYSSLPGTNQSDGVTVANIANEVWDDVTKAESFAGDVEYRCTYFTNTHDADPFLSVAAYIASQPSPGAIAIGVDPAGVGDGVTRSVNSITRSGTVATVTTAASHGYADGQTVRIIGADQTQYNGLVVIDATGADTFTYTVAGSPATPATGTLQCSRGVPLTVANEGTAPSGVAFSAPVTSGTALDLGQVGIGECVPLWTRRTIPLRNTTSNTETLSKLAIPAYY